MTNKLTGKELNGYLHFFCLLVLCFALISTYTYALPKIELLNAQQDTLLQAQDLQFFSCVDDYTLLSTKVICVDTQKNLPAETTQWNDSCEYGIADLSANFCNVVRVETTYSDSLQAARKMTKDIRVNRVLSEPTDLLARQEIDGGWGSPSLTAYAIWSLSKDSIAYKKEIDYGLDWLKANRINSSKCWYSPLSPKACDVTETTLTLLFLKLSNLNESKRIVSDGTAYVESLQNYLTGDDWTLKITATDADMNCSVDLDGSDIVTDEQINEDVVFTDVFLPEYGANLNITCSDEFDLELLDHRGIQALSHQFDEDSTYDYTHFEPADINDSEDETIKTIRIPDPCWTSTAERWDECSEKITLYATSLDIDEEQQLDAKEWLETNLQNHSKTGRYMNTDQTHIDSALYLAIIEQDEDVLNWLLFTQANDGSFGIGSLDEKITATGIAIQALKNMSFAQKAEVIADAIHYISTQYEQKGKQSIRTDAVLFQTLYNNSVFFLKIKNATIPVVTDSTTITLSNPSVFTIVNVTYDITNVTTNLQASASGPQTILPGQSIQVTLQNTNIDAGLQKGILSISGTVLMLNDSMDVKLKEVYFQTMVDAQLAISAVKNEYHVYDKALSYALSVSKINAPATCTLAWDSQYLSGAEFSVTETGEKTVKLTVNDFERGTITTAGTLTCTALDETFKTPLSIHTIIHDALPIQVNTEEVQKTAYFKQFKIDVTNTWVEPIDVTVKFSQPTENLALAQETYTIEPSQTIRIPISSTFDKNANITESNRVIFSTLDAQVSTTIRLEVVNVPADFSMVIWIVLSIAIIAAGFAGFMYKRELTRLINPYLKNIPLLKKNTATGKPTDPNYRYILDIISIMKRLNKREDEITTRLIREGYAKAQVDKILDDVRQVETRLEAVKHEDTVLNIVRSLSADSEVIQRVLKEKGFSEAQISDALAELSETTEKKERQLKKDAGLE